MRVGRTYANAYCYQTRTHIPIIHPSYSHSVYGTAFWVKVVLSGKFQEKDFVFFAQICNIRAAARPENREFSVTWTNWEINRNLKKILIKNDFICAKQASNLSAGV